jgi:hypothetical protein
MTDMHEKGFTLLNAKPSTHALVKAYCDQHQITMYELINLAVKEYIANHSDGELRKQ